MKEEEAKAFTFRIPVSLLKAGHALADAQDMSLAQLLRRVLADRVSIKQGSSRGF
jgi:predicted HicB family RNase H-like nuclease